MTLLLPLLALAQSDLSAADFFPLKPGMKFYYDDSSQPGSPMTDTVQEKILPAPQQNEKGEITHQDPPMVPVKRSFGGEVIGDPCYRIDGDTVYYVADYPKRPVPPRPILRVSEKRTEWEFYAGTASPLEPNAVDVHAACEPGPIQTFLGKTCHTFVVTMDASVGGKKGLKVHRIMTYAENLGLVLFQEDGTANGSPIHHTSKLTKVETGESTAH